MLRTEIQQLKEEERENQREIGEKFEQRIQLMEFNFNHKIKMFELEKAEQAKQFSEKIQQIQTDATKLLSQTESNLKSQIRQNQIDATELLSQTESNFKSQISEVNERSTVTNSNITSLQAIVNFHARDFELLRIGANSEYIFEIFKTFRLRHIPFSITAPIYNSEYHYNNLFKTDDSAFCSPKVPNSFVRFHFTTCCVCLSSYTLKVTRDHQPKNWTLKASHDGSNWIFIDKYFDEDFPRYEYPRSFSRSFICKHPSKEYFSYFQLTQTGLNSSGEHYFQLQRMEFNGSVITL